MSKVKTPGGKRKGAGRPKSPIKTKAVGQRVPIKFHTQIVQMVKLEVERLLALEASQNGL